MSGKLLLRTLALVLLVISIGLLWIHHGLHEWLVGFAREHLSPDNIIEEPGIRYLTRMAPISGLIFLGYSLILFLLSLGPSYKRLVGLAREIAREVNRRLEISPHGAADRFVLYFSSALAAVNTLVFMISFWPLHVSGWEFLYREDGVMEYATAIMLLLSSLALAWRALTWPGDGKALRSAAHGQGNPAWFLMLIAAAAFLLGMEEISWGQRIFGWDTPDILQEINLQNETNLHNLLSWNHWLHLCFIVLPLIVILPMVRPNIPLSRKVPDVVKIHPNLVGLALIIGLLALPPFTYPLSGFGELMEELFALFVFILTSNVLTCPQPVSRRSAHQLAGQGIARQGAGPGLEPSPPRIFPIAIRQPRGGGGLPG